MKVAHLLAGIGVCLGLSACAVQRSPEANAPEASSATTPAPAEPQPGAPVAPAPAPPAAKRDTPKSTAIKEEAEFANLEAAERALNQAKADLDRLALAEPSPVVAESAAADRAAEKKANKTSRAPAAAGAPAPAAAKPNAVCEDTCRAFASLSRAADAVCRLDGNDGTHCSHAKHVLSDARKRVASCSCPAASD